MSRNDPSADHRASRSSSAEWYTIRPSSLLLAIGYLLVLLVRPLIGETEIHAGSAFVLTAVAAMLLAWFAWRLIGRSDRVANLVFCTVVSCSAVWTLVLTPPQRAAATDAMLSTPVGQQATELGLKAREVLARI
ncbi:MAG: hypothetical protein ACYTJ0_12410 [Planctomycetota bacterium]|jgi:hypothetical protein